MMSARLLLLRRLLHVQTFRAVCSANADLMQRMKAGSAGAVAWLKGTVCGAEGISCCRVAEAFQRRHRHKVATTGDRFLCLVPASRYFDPSIYLDATKSWGQDWSTVAGGAVACRSPNRWRL